MLSMAMIRMDYELLCFKTIRSQKKIILNILFILYLTLCYAGDACGASKLGATALTTCIVCAVYCQPNKQHML